MELIDTHCHIHDVNFYTPEEQAEVYKAARQAGVGMICVGTDQADSRAAVRYASEHEGAWAVVGVHPHDAKDGVDDIGVLLEESLGGLGVGGNASRQPIGGRERSGAPLVGIGEIGLDYFYNHSPREVQIEALEKQLQWAMDYDLPISFHVREAYDDFWPIFDNFHGLRGALHSFTDTQVNVDRAFERNLYIGVNGISTFTKNEEQKAMFAGLPLSRIILETDAPFLTPAPLRGKMNMPSYVGRVAEYVATLYNVPYIEVATTTTTNARQLFGIN